MKKKTPRAPRVHVSVDEQTIETSVGRDSSHCMIAEAVRAAIPNARHVAVDLQTIRVTDTNRGLRYTYLTPRVAQIPLIQFDQGEKPDPFAFVLRNGQVTRSGKRQVRTQENLTPKKQSPERAAEKVAHLKKARQSQSSLAKTRLVHREGGELAGTVPDRVGGKTPPITSFARRRAFGLRALRG